VPVLALSQADRFPAMPPSTQERELENLAKQLHDLQRHMEWARAVGAGAGKTRNTDAAALRVRAATAGEPGISGVTLFPQAD
jgi:hypothetical protein